MSLYRTKDREEIKETIEFLITQGLELRVQIEGQGTPYTSKIIKANYGGVHTRHGNTPQLVTKRLAPEDGNTLIKPGSHLAVKFLVGNRLCRFRTDYLGPRSDGSESELVMSFPDSMELPERRKQERNIDEIPDFISVVLTPKKGANKGKKYELAVLDYSARGVGILVSKKDSELIEAVKEGDRIQDITLFAPQTMVTVDGTVRHKSKQKGAQDEGSYVLGIEFDETISDFRSL